MLKWRARAEDRPADRSKGLPSEVRQRCCAWAFEATGRVAVLLVQVLVPVLRLGSLLTELDDHEEWQTASGGNRRCWVLLDEGLSRSRPGSWSWRVCRSIRVRYSRLAYSGRHYSRKVNVPARMLRARSSAREVAIDHQTTRRRLCRPGICYWAAGVEAVGHCRSHCRAAWGTPWQHRYRKVAAPVCSGRWTSRCDLLRAPA